MSDHFFSATHPKARKEHSCIYCFGPIIVGEQYVQQEGFFDGEAYRNRFHAECFNACCEEAREYGDGEFTPGEADYPERVREIVKARRGAA